MKIYASMFLLFVTFVTLSAQTAQENSQKVWDQLSKTVIPRIAANQASLKDVLDAVQKQGVAANPNVENIKIIIDPSVSGSNGMKVTLSLANIPESELLRYISSLAGLRLAIDGNTVKFISGDAKVDVLITKRYDNIAPAFFPKTPVTDALCRQYFMENGVLFPNGSSAHYDSMMSSITIRDTKDNLDLCDTIIGAWMEAVKKN